MREIKFRAWDGEKMILPGSPNEHLIAAVIFNIPGSGKYEFLKIMQYTGLKDKNGKEICVGDILQRPSSINSEYHGAWIRDEVIYKPGVFFASHVSSEKGKIPRGYTAGELLDSHFDYDGKSFAFHDDYQPRTQSEVIGNIYENPELLEGS